MAKIAILGLSITSSWGNGHATTYRSLVKALAKRGHEVVFLERDMPWYAAARDLPEPDYCRTILYSNLADLHRIGAPEISSADAVIVGSYVPDGIAVGEWAIRSARGPVAFYDIDTPVTLAKLRGDEEYLNRTLLSSYDVYFSFTGGKTLQELSDMGARAPIPLYCSVDPEVHRPMNVVRQWLMGYLGTYSADRQQGLEALLCDTARRMQDDAFVVAGPQYPDTLSWPSNVERIEHLAPSEHAAFYCSQHFTLNLTRADMRSAGFAPSVRLFEAAACGVPIISDRWDGIESIFRIGEEIFLAEGADEMIAILERTTPAEREAVAAAARARVLAHHTSDHRAAELLAALSGVLCSRAA